MHALRMIPQYSPAGCIILMLSQQEEMDVKTFEKHNIFLPVLLFFTVPNCPELRLQR